MCIISEGGRAWCRVLLPCGGIAPAGPLERPQRGLVTDPAATALASAPTGGASNERDINKGGSK